MTMFGFLRLIPGAGLVSPWRWVRRITTLVVVGYVLLSLSVVATASRRDDGDRRVGAIVVLGAAQYNGRPSPVLKRRLDHALELYRRGAAKRIVVTGGRQEGDRVTEASAAASYLIRRGVPDRAIEREVQGRDSYGSIAATSRFLRAAGVTDVVFVTDGYHAARVRGIGEEVGLRSFVSPVGGTGSASRLLKETVAIGCGELIGYRRLSVLLG